MASSSGVFGAAATQPPPPRLSLTAEERSLYGQLFKSLDTESIGIVTGEVARSLFERSGLTPLVLGRIWQIADDQNNGFLNQTGFSIAMRLIGYVQNGQHLAPELASRPGPLPRFGEQPEFNRSMSPAHTTSQSTPQLFAAGTVPPLNPADRTRFIQLFESSTSESLLSGSVARDIFLRAQLPTETLGQIWNLSDIHRRGALDATEFVIAMHLIQCTLNGSMPTIPQSIPPALFTAAAAVHDRPISRSSARSNNSTPQIPPPISQQYSGMPPPPRARGSYGGHISPAPAPAQRPISTGGSQTPQFGVSRVSSFSPNEDWLVTPQQKEHFDSIFATVDREGNGKISGAIAVPFFMTSKLPEDTLAQIWDLSDIHNTGFLSKDEFAVAMYLVQQRLSGVELPVTLPPALIPPSSRQLPQHQNQQQESTPFGGLAQTAQQQQRDVTGQQQQPAAPESSLLDLFDLDEAAFTAPPTSQHQFSPSVSSAVSQQDSTSESPHIPPQPALPTPSVMSLPPLSPTITGRQPFKPSSAFGQTLTQQSTGGGLPYTSASVVSSAPSLPPLPVPIENAPTFSSPSRSSTFTPLSAQNTGSAEFSAPSAVPISAPTAPVSAPVFASVEEDDREIKQKISAEATQFGKLSTEIGNMTSQTAALKEKRAKAEAELTKMVALRTDIEGKLRVLRGAYESEVSKVRAVEQHLAVSTNETAKLRQELSELEIGMREMQIQYQDITSNLESDQSENATLKEKIRQLSEQSAHLKAETEKAREDARQQKGMVASNRNQLMNAEAELENQTRNLSSTKSELAEAIAATATTTAAASVSDTPTSARSATTNPFFSNPGSTFSSPAVSPPVSPTTVPSTSTANGGYIFESMFADFGQAPEHSSSLDGPAPVESAHSVETSESSSLPRTGYEDSLDDEMPSPSTTTTTTFTNNAGPVSLAAAIAAGGTAAGLRAADLESVSSSVQNNAPESVREGLSRPDTPNNVPEASAAGTHSPHSSVSVVTASEGGATSEDEADRSPVVNDESNYVKALEPELSMGGGFTTEAINDSIPAEAVRPVAAESGKEDPFGLKAQTPEQYTGTREQFDAVFSGLGLLPKSQGATPASKETSKEIEPEAAFSSDYPPIEDINDNAVPSAEVAADDSSSDDEGPEEFGETMRLASKSPVEAPKVAALDTGIPSEPPAYFESDPEAAAAGPSKKSSPSLERSGPDTAGAYSEPQGGVYTLPSEPIISPEPFSESSAPVASDPKDAFASFEDSFASAPAQSASPFDFSAAASSPAAPVPAQDAFDAMFASFSAPPQTANNTSLSGGPPLPPKIPISSGMPGGFGSGNPVDEFDNAFATLEDSKEVSGENDPAKTSHATKAMFDDSAFADFEKF
ncbi:uncharacterized protein V2V93DRAFT_341278 [Kockiozyma suomiensis]|uniref:uncharacterized protein n=1 Tax=Kockiozyma suomiensis TaxID=1337062 RepID=UPI003343AC9C